MAVYKKPSVIRINPDICEKIKIIAFKQRRSVTKQIEHILIEYIIKYEKLHGTIKLDNENEL